MNPWIGILIVLAALAVTFICGLLLRHFASPSPELVRKLIHVPMGLVTASFPWLFDQPWPVLTLAGVSLLLLIVVRTGYGIAGSLKGVLHDVDRSSWGDLCFPVAVTLLFVMTDGDHLLYCVPILILTLADPVAAMVGIRYGQLTYTTYDGWKSVEGSLAFFFVTFLCVHLALLLFTDTGRTESLLISLLMGLIVTMFEAVAWRGLDNLFIPLASYVLLQNALSMETTMLLSMLLVILLTGLLLLLFRQRSTLDDSALMGALLVAFGAWSIGDFDWLLVPLLLFLAVTLLTPRVALDGSRHNHDVYALLGIVGPGFVWLILSRQDSSQALFIAYSVAFSAHATMLAISRAHFSRADLPSREFVSAVLQGLMVLILPLLILGEFNLQLLTIAVIGLSSMLMAGFAFLYFQPALDDCPATVKRWSRQAFIASGVSVIAWLFMQLSLPAGVP